MNSESFSPLALALARKFCELYRPSLIWERMSTGRRERVLTTMQKMIDEGYIRRGVRFDENLD